MDTLLNELKDYLRIDGDVENASLLTFLQAAQIFLENSGVKQPEDYFKYVNGRDVFAQHRLAIMLLATHYYENRIVNTPTAIKTAQIPLPYGLQSLILQLKWVNPGELSTQQ